VCLLYRIPQGLNLLALSIKDLSALFSKRVHAVAVLAISLVEIRYSGHYRFFFTGRQWD